MAKEKSLPSAKEKVAAVSASKFSSQKNKEKEKPDFAFGRINYLLMLIGIALIFIGYMLMSGGKSSDPKIFNPDVFSFRRITLAPFVVIVGYVVEVFAIVIKAKD
jgi:uncharacterized membrane protein